MHQLFYLRTPDGTTITGTSFDKSVLDDTKSKIVENISFNLSNYVVGTRITIYISKIHGSYEIESKDKDWVNAKVGELEDIIRITPNQNYWLSNFNMQFFITIAVGVMFGALLFSVLIIKVVNDGEPPIEKTFLFKPLFRLYPENDFDTTSDHLNMGESSRAEHQVDHITQIKWNKDKKCLEVYYENGDWYHYEDCTWY